MQMIFKEDFFLKETRCGFEISEMMKRAWSAELEVLEIVVDICNRNKLQYFADWGTLLGAVRHQGFIPWDDDIDICLKREDYNQLIQILPQELPYGMVMTGMYAKTRRLQEVAEVPQLRVMADETLINFNKPGYHLMSLIALGVPEENTPPAPKRKPLEEVVTFID